jgi:hypothetical protein
VFLIEVLLPLYDNARRQFDASFYGEVAAELTEQFGGLTAHTRAPATGLWKPSEDEHATRDDIVIYEVMTERVDREWWGEYRRRLETRFRQEHLVIRAIAVEVL